MIIGSDSGWLMLAGMIGAAAGDLLADEFRRHVIGNAGAEILAVADQRTVRRLAAEIFADGDIFHFRCDDTGAGIGDLGYGLAVSGAQRLIADRKFRRQPLAGGKAVILRFDMAAVIGFDVAACGDPVLALPGQAGIDRDEMRRIRIGAGGIVDGDGRFARGRVHGNFAHGNADIRIEFARNMHLARCRQRAGGDCGGNVLCGNSHG
jgi:hypothetical protein